jgi:hypothetical protein
MITKICGECKGFGGSRESLREHGVVDGQCAGGRKRTASGRRSRVPCTVCDRRRRRDARCKACNGRGIVSAETETEATL